MAAIECELQGKRVLVTGAAGFIGSRLVEELLNCGAEVVALVDDKSNMARIEPLLASSRLHLRRCSLDDIRALSVQRQEWGDVDLVAHLGLAIPTSTNFSEQSIEEINVNMLPTMNLIRVLGDSVQGICFASSISVYGYPAHLPLREDDLPAPISPYAVTKLAIENYLRAYGRASQVPVTILRYATVYGPGELKHRAIPNFLHAIEAGQPPVIYGDGSEIRDYVYIDDVVRATISALALKPAQVLNIGSGRGYTVLQIAQELIRLFGADIEPEFIPIERQNINLTCDISAASKALNYFPQTDLEKGLMHEIEWFKKQTKHSVTKGENKHTTVQKGRGWLRNLSNYSSWKSLADRLMALLGIIISSPVMALIALGIKLDSRESPIFAQERIGKDGCKFVAYKFRTMHTNGNDSKYKEYLKKYVLENAPYRVDENGNGVYKVDDSHVTRFGKLLRKTNLDELPQIFNVLKGEMSFVGPRPDIPFSVGMYKNWHLKRLGAKPGITGLWQVCGRRNLSFEGMVRLDIDYIKRQSLFLDTKILLLTVGTVLRKDGS